MKIGSPLMKNLLMSLAKSALVLLGLMVAASATDPPIQKKIGGLGTKTLIFSNEDLNDIIWFIDKRCY